MVVGRGEGKYKDLIEACRKARCEILNEFEKVCPTDISFNRVKKGVHDIFDNIERLTLRNISEVKTDE
jgi:hypothetical protein